MSSRLGEILVKDSLISADQLKQALEHQKKMVGVWEPVLSNWDSSATTTSPQFSPASTAFLPST
jgi:hypothetical protein